LQNEQGLNDYIDYILTEKSERKRKQNNLYFDEDGNAIDADEFEK